MNRAAATACLVLAACPPGTPNPGTPATPDAKPQTMIDAGVPEDVLGPPWRLIWQDEFDGAANARPDSTKWRHDVGGDGWGNAQLEFDTDRVENASLDGQGKLRITARREAYGGRQYTSARINSAGKFLGSSRSTSRKAANAPLASFRRRRTAARFSQPGMLAGSAPTSRNNSACAVAKSPAPRARAAA